MEETIRNYLIQYSRLLPHCKSRLEELTREDYVKKTSKYLSAISYRDKLEYIH